MAKLYADLVMQLDSDEQYHCLSCMAQPLEHLNLPEN